MTTRNDTSYAGAACAIVGLLASEGYVNLEFDDLRQRGDSGEQFSAMVALIATVLQNMYPRTVNDDWHDPAIDY